MNKRAVPKVGMSNGQCPKMGQLALPKLLIFNDLQAKNLGMGIASKPVGLESEYFDFMPNPAKLRNSKSFAYRFGRKIRPKDKFLYETKS